MNAQMWRRVAAVGCGWVALGFYCLGVVVLFGPLTVDSSTPPSQVFVAMFGGFSAFAAAVGLTVAAMRLWGRR